MPLAKQQNYEIRSVLRLSFSKFFCTNANYFGFESSDFLKIVYTNFAKSKKIADKNGNFLGQRTT